MDKLPTELVCMICAHLPCSDLSRLCLTTHKYQRMLEGLLYRQYALPKTPLVNNMTKPERSKLNSAVWYAVGVTHLGKPETQAEALVTLEKVARYCDVTPSLLDRCCRLRSIQKTMGVDTLERAIAFMKLDNIILTYYSSPNPLHVAAARGWDDIVAWLLAHGANVNLTMMGAAVSAVSLAVVAGHASTVRLLLANDADPVLPVEDTNTRSDTDDSDPDDSNHDDDDFDDSDNDDGAGHGHAEINNIDIYAPRTVFHLVCSYGLAELASLLSSPYMNVDPSLLFDFYCSCCKPDTLEIMQELVGLGAEVSDMQLLALIGAGRLALAGAVLALPAYYEHLTKDRANRLLRQVLVYYSHNPEEIDSFKHVLPLLQGRGADPSLFRRLWRDMNGVSSYGVLQILPLLLEAGINVGASPTKGKESNQDSSSVPDNNLDGNLDDDLDDFLSHTSTFKGDQYEDEDDAKLAIVRLLLQHGALIGPVTRRDALDSYPAKPPPGTGQGRWAYELCRVLLDHCLRIPKDQRGEDVVAFLSGYADVKTRHGESLDIRVDYVI